MKILKSRFQHFTVPKKEHILSIEEELIIDYQKYPIAKEFFTNLRKQSPRYVYPQCNRIRRLQKYYTEEQMVDGFGFCVRGNICSVKELCSYFIYRYGEEKAKQYIPVHTYRHYRERADEIREVMMNGNDNGDTGFGKDSGVVEHSKKNHTFRIRHLTNQRLRRV